jgi:hypothetical protein
MNGISNYSELTGILDSIYSSKLEFSSNLCRIVLHPGIIFKHITYKFMSSSIKRFLNLPEAILSIIFQSIQENGNSIAIMPILP